MAGDVVFTATLKDDGVSRGLRAIDNAADQSARKGASLAGSFGKYGGAVAKWAVPGLVAIKGITAVMELQSEALTAYAAKNDTVASAVERHAAAHQKLMEDVGREVSYGATLSGMWDTVTESVTKAYNAVVKFAAEEMSKVGQGGQGAANLADKDQSMRIMEEQTKEGKAQAMIFMESLKAQEAMMREQDDVLGADLLQARIMKLQEMKQLAEQAKKEGWTSGTTASMRGLVDQRFDSRVNAAHRKQEELDARNARERAKEQEDIRDEAQRDDKEQATQREASKLASLEFDTQRDISKLQSEQIGKSEKERDVLEARIQLRQQLLDLEKDKSFSAGEKEVLAADARLLAARQIEAILGKEDEKAGKVSASSLTAGAGGVFSHASLVGPGSVGSVGHPGLDEARKQVKLAEQMVAKQQQTVDALKRFSDSGGLTARFGL